MLRTSTTRTDPSNQLQSPSNLYNYKILSEAGVRSTSARTSTNSVYSFHSGNSEKNHSTLLTSSLSDRNINSSTRLSTPISLNDLIIDGRWSFRSTYDERLLFKAQGIENLVYTCYDILYKTRDLVDRKKSIEMSISQMWSSIEFRFYETMTTNDRIHCSQKRILDLMTIVYQAATTHSTRAKSKEIDDESNQALTTSENTNGKCSLTTLNDMKISHELAIKHLLKSTDGHLLSIAVHASMIAGSSRMDLQTLGDKYGVRRNQFDMGSLKDSTSAFQDFIRLLIEQKGKAEREQQTVDTKKLPCKPRKKRGLTANVCGTKFPVGKFFFSSFLLVRVFEII